MRSKYQKFKFRSVRSEKEKDLALKERWGDWWYYHKWYVIVGVVLFGIAADLILNALQNQADQPDYQIAYVGNYPLPDDTVTALEEALAAYGEDLNQDGQVIVRINSYPLLEDSSSEEDAMYAAASVAKLMADLEQGESVFFLLEDPEAFQEDYSILRLLDGSLPEEGEAGGLDCALSWGDCPLLAGLSLGDYAYSSLGETISGKSQELLENLYIARRGFWDETDEDLSTAYDAFWDVLTAGAP